MDDGLCPDERRGASIVAGDEVIDVGPELLDAGETGGGEGIALRMENQISIWFSQAEYEVGVK